MGKKILNRTRIFKLLTLVLSVLTCIVYRLDTVETVYLRVIALLIVTAVLELVLCIKPLKYMEYVPFICALISMGIFIRSAFDTIGAVLSKISTTGLSALWIATAVMIILTSIVAGLATVFVKED